MTVLESESNLPLARLWSQSVLEQLNEQERSRYESLCDALEEKLCKGVSASALVKQLKNEDSPFRELALLNLAKCWAEDNWKSIASLDLEAIDPILLNTFAELTSFPEAHQEWRDWFVEEQERRRMGEASPETVATRSDVSAEDIIPSSHELIQELSRTRMSRVFLVRNIQVNRQEVFKAVRLAELHPALRDRLEDEAKRAGKIPHPGLVQVFAAGTQGGWRFLLMEYMNGGSLADRLRSGPLPWEIAIRLFANVARALHALHEKGGLAHGDIKPANLMFTRLADDDEHLKIGDFGLSSELKRDEQDVGIPTYVLGTPGYLAPELLQQAPATAVPFDTRVMADVFALGISLYQTLSGVLPYQRPAERAPLQIDPRGPLVNPYTPIEDLVSGLPDVVAYVIKRACATDRTQRFASAAEFARALEKCVPLTSPENRVEPMPIPKPSAIPVTSRSPVRSKIILGAIAGVMALVILGFFFRPYQNEPSVVVRKINDGDGKTIHNGGERPEPDGPSPTDSPDLKQFLEKGWTREAAKATLDLNSSWFDTLKSDPRTAPLAKRQVELLADLGDHSPSMNSFARQPHVASALLLSDSRHYADMEKYLLDDDPAHRSLFSNLLVQYPHALTADHCVDTWNAKREAISTLHRHGLFGAEQMYLSAGKTDESFVHWADDLMVRRINEHPEQAPNLLAIFLEHHQAIARRLKEDRVFAERFPTDLWPKFLKLSVEPKLGSALYHGGVWDVLQVEGGDDMLRKYRMLAVVIFSGADALPADPELQQLAIGHLKDGFQPVVEALCDKKIRKNKDFQTLLKRGLSKKVFAVLCKRLIDGNAEELLADSLKKKNAQLEADIIGVDVNRWAIEEYIPQALYVRLGLKVLSGETLYDVEKSAALKQIAADVVSYVLPEVGLSKEFVDSFQKGYGIGKELGDNVAKELLRQEQFQAMTVRPETKSEEEVVIARAKELRNLLGGLGDSLGSQQDTPVLDVTTTRMLFERIVCVCEGDRNLRKVDLRKVRLFRLSDGRMFAMPLKGNAELETPALQRYFGERMARLSQARTDRQRDEEVDRAYRETVSAWWLLAACECVPSTH